MNSPDPGAWFSATEVHRLGHLKTRLTFLVLVFVGGLAAAEKARPAPVPVEGPVVVLPSFVVIGHQIPTSWLEVSWECTTSLPFSPVKRAWVSKVGWETPAAKVGIKVGDRLLAIGGVEVGSMGGEILHALLQLERDAGTRLEFTLQTPGREKRIVAILFQESPPK